MASPIHGPDERDAPEYSAVRSLSRSVSMAASTATSAIGAPPGTVRAGARPRTFWRDRARKFGKQPPAMIGLVLVGIFLVATVIGQFGTPANTNRNSLSTRLRAPDTTNPLGTDGFGRSVMFRILQGAPLALAVGVVSVA